MVKRFIMEEDGAETLEYVALIAAAIALIGVVKLITDANKTKMSNAPIKNFDWPTAAH